MDKSFLVEDANCQTCEERGKCPIEYVGGEGKALFPLEMEIVIAAVEAGLENIEENWVKQAAARERLATLLAEEHEAGFKDYCIGESSEGSEYFLFSLRQLERMQGIIEVVKPIVEEAKQRASKAFAAKTAGNADR
jgi:hypothetical protein